MSMFSLASSLATNTERLWGRLLISESIIVRTFQHANFKFSFLLFAPHDKMPIGSGEPTGWVETSYVWATFSRPVSVRVEQAELTLKMTVCSSRALPNDVVNSQTTHVPEPPIHAWSKLQLPVPSCTYCFRLFPIAVGLSFPHFLPACARNLSGDQLAQTRIQNIEDL